MNKSIAAIAMTVFTGLTLAAAAPAPDAQAGVKKNTHCVKHGTTNATNCRDKLKKRRYQRPTPTTNRTQTRKFNFSTRTDFEFEKVGGGGNGGGAGGGGKR